MWLCCRCGLRQWVGMEQLASGLAKPCKQVYTGKDQWIVACIKKFAPKKEGFFQPQGFLRKEKPLVPPVVCTRLKFPLVMDMVMKP